MAVKPLSPIQVSDQECNGSFEKMLRRFVRRVKEEGILTEYRRRGAFMKPSQVRRRRKTASRGGKRTGNPTHKSDQ